MLECVCEAHTCPWVQQVLRKFVELTGYHLTQGELHLQQTWAARRSRWWCVLSHPSLGKISWEPPPKILPMPMVCQLLNQWKICTPEELKHLGLDLYELGRFAAHGFESNMIPWTGQMATSLHSCGNQLTACPCGCREFPFTDQRLASGGLHGLLIQTPGLSKCGQQVYPNFRHIHPDELALLNGMMPGLDWGTSPKMALCALGKLASPLQSIWIGSFILKHVQEMDGIANPVHPKRCLYKYMLTLLDARDKVFGPSAHTGHQGFSDLDPT